MYVNVIPILWIHKYVFVYSTVKLVYNEDEILSVLLSEFVTMTAPIDNDNLQATSGSFY